MLYKKITHGVSQKELLKVGVERRRCGITYTGYYIGPIYYVGYWLI